MGNGVTTGTFYATTTIYRTRAYRNWYFDSEGNLYNSLYRTRYYLQNYRAYDAYGTYHDYAVLSYLN